MDMLLVTQYFDTMKEIGASSKSSSVFIPHGPGAVEDISSQIQEGLLLAHATQDQMNIQAFDSLTLMKILIFRILVQFIQQYSSKTETIIRSFFHMMKYHHSRKWPVGGKHRILWHIIASNMLDQKVHPPFSLVSFVFERKPLSYLFMKLDHLTGILTQS